MFKCVTVILCIQGVLNVVFYCTIAKMHFQSEEGKKGVKAALDNPMGYVLKPQREGGGNNVYGEDIPKILRQILQSTEKDAFILMDRIRPCKVPGYILRAGGEKTPTLGEVIGELGIFGYILGDADNICVNEQVS